MRPFLSALFITVLVVAVPPVSGNQTPSQPLELLRRLQARYDTVRDFKADFTQTFKGILLRTSMTERGKMSVKKPGRFKFVYDVPEHKEFVSDGVSLYVSIPSQGLRSVTPLQTDAEGWTALLYLSGQGKLADRVIPSLPEPQPKSEWRLCLRPRVREADFDTLTLILDRTTLMLRGFTTADEQGTNEIQFSNVKENVGLRDTDFSVRSAGRR